MDHTVAKVAKISETPDVSVANVILEAQLTCIIIYHKIYDMVTLL